MHITFLEPIGIFFSEPGIRTFFIENFNGSSGSFSIGGNFILFFEAVLNGASCLWSILSYYDLSRLITFSDRTFFIFFVESGQQSIWPLSGSIYFFVANPTVFFALFSNFACGSLLFKNRSTLGHFIGSIKLMSYSYCLNFSRLSSIPLKIVVSRTSAASGLMSSSTVRHIRISSESYCE